MYNLLWTNYSHKQLIQFAHYKNKCTWCKASKNKRASFGAQPKQFIPSGDCIQQLLKIFSNPTFRQALASASHCARPRCMTIRRRRRRRHRHLLPFPITASNFPRRYSNWPNIVTMIKRIHAGHSLDNRFEAFGIGVNVLGHDDSHSHRLWSPLHLHTSLQVYDMELEQQFEVLEAWKKICF